MSVNICVRNSRQDGKDGSAGELKATDCGASAFSWKNMHLIAALWAASSQMSQDTDERLVQHANETAVASPTAKHWLAACFLFLQLRPALLHSRKQVFIVGLFLTEGATSSPGTDACLWGKSLAAPGHCLWSVREVSDLRRTEENTRW